MNYAPPQNHYGDQEPAPASSTPITLDLNNLGAAIAQLESSIDKLQKQLDPVIRPLPPNPTSTTEGTKAPQLVKSERSSNGRVLENLADAVGRLTAQVDFLKRAVEV